jgi:peptidoglycan/LPS O-acetylase OafA/YrhL
MPSRGWLESWHVNPSANKDYDFVDGLRGVAILMVLGCHLLYADPRAGRPVQFLVGVFSAGACGVTLFFGLSGFLISWPFWKLKVKGANQVIPRGYGWRRFWKIYPPLALSVILLTPIYLLRFSDPELPKLALQWLAGWPLVAPVSGVLNPVMWSLVVEVHFYLLLPVLFLAVKRVAPRQALWALLLVLLCVPTGFRWILASRGLYFTLHPDIHVRFPSFLDAFALGVLIAGLENLAMMRKSWARLGDAGFVLLGGALLARAWLIVNPAWDSFVFREAIEWMVKLATGLLLCYVADPAHPRVRWLSTAWLRWFGLISYELYLFHQPLAIWTKLALGPTRADPWLTAGLRYGTALVAALILSLTIAALVYRFFSLPILRLKREKHRPNPVLPAVAAEVKT